MPADELYRSADPELVEDTKRATPGGNATLNQAMEARMVLPRRHSLVSLRRLIVSVQQICDADRL